ncbi:MAG: hypothetical protein PUC64_08590 [Clostridium sp.]|nr:hypothetical protein [Clostridium sp.]
MPRTDIPIRLNHKGILLLSPVLGTLLLVLVNFAVEVFPSEIIPVSPLA